MSEDRPFWRAQLTPRKLTFDLIFHGFHIAIFIVGWWKQATDNRLAALNTLNFSVWFSRGAGLVLSVDVLLILLPMCRNLLRIIRPKVRYLPLDESQWFHRQCAYSLLFWTIVHTASHYVNFFNVERFQVRKETAVQIHYAQAGGITGHIMLFCMFMMYTTAHHKIRQQSYETFWYTHHLFVPFLLAMYTHATGCFVRDSAEPYSPFAGKEFWSHCIGYQGWRWELIGGGLYLIERIYRELRARRKTEIIKVVKHPYDAVEIQFRKPSMAYKPGQWLFLNLPSVSRHQWHPFTITSCPFDPYISVHVRQVGDFTRALADALGAGPHQAELYDQLDPLGMYEVALSNGQEMPALRIDGPYGAPAEDVFENEVAVLIGTGIGVTPWAAILKNIWHLRLSPNPPKRLRRVEFIWVCRDTTSFEWFQALLSSLEEQSLELSSPGAGGNGIEFLRIHTYLTQALDVDTAQNIVLNSVGTEKDPLTELRNRTNFGRPDFAKLLGGMRDGLVRGDYLGEELGGPAQRKGRRTEVGVYFCGPNNAARHIKKACKDATVDQVKFKFWKEHY
ncbi:ferric/cupric reductase transmembrane component-like protein 2 [Elsinoe australis]|uniref:Ferric/cupric reductase transmembrane component-like protein 2 n=1 Tax=Elsinoe australis TaxID=40998 RepID=A0A4U7B9H2_9PEZI|nr:ferric/cupric reductase transmembrane component-like protein 2 [Elsinoe australis]